MKSACATSPSLHHDVEGVVPERPPPTPSPAAHATGREDEALRGLGVPETAAAALGSEARRAAGTHATRPTAAPCGHQVGHPIGLVGVRRQPLGGRLGRHGRGPAGRRLALAGPGPTALPPGRGGVDVRGRRDRDAPAGSGSSWPSTASRKVWSSVWVSVSFMASSAWRWRSATRSRSRCCVLRRPSHSGERAIPRLACFLTDPAEIPRCPRSRPRTGRGSTAGPAPAVRSQRRDRGRADASRWAWAVRSTIRLPDRGTCWHRRLPYGRRRSESRHLDRPSRGSRRPAGAQWD